MSFFRSRFVMYNGLEIDKEYPLEIVRAQKHIGYVLKGIEYYRIRYGSEEYEGCEFNADIPCHDCAVLKGQYHTDGCDVEQCPKCQEQALGCGCFIEADIIVK